MADNVTYQAVTLATPPSATAVATDDVGGAHYQRVKLDVGGDGASTPVTSAAPLPVSQLAVAVAAAVTSVNDTAASTQLLASNASRKGYKLYNDSTAIAYVKEGTTASTTDYSYQIQSLGYYESVGVGSYTGRIDCIWATDAAGAMKITELT